MAELLPRSALRLSRLEVRAPTPGGTDAGYAKGEAMRALSAHLKRLVAYLVAGGVLLCAVLGITAYGILSRIDQGFAVFG